MARKHSLLPVQVLLFVLVTLLAFATDNLKHWCPSVGPGVPSRQSLPLAGITALPELRTLRPRLAAIADTCDPLELQRAFAAAMLSAEANESGVCFGVLRR